MTVRQVWVLRGPNIWARVPVLDAWLQRDRPERNSVATNPAFPDRITELVHVLSRTRPCRRKPAGLLDSMGGPAELVARLALELQSVGEPVLEFWKAWEQTPEEGISRVVIQFREQAMGRAALTSACEMVRAFLDDQPYDVEGAVGRLNDLAYDVLLGQSTQAIVDAAQARGIPWCRLNEANLVMFGQGVKQRRILTAETDRTGAIAEAIAKDKELTRSMLQAVGVPCRFPTGGR
jgi:cyanophycin synthetase